MAGCPYANFDCTGPADGERWWVCPVHGARLTQPLSDLCRAKENYYDAWRDGRGPLQAVDTKSSSPKPAYCPPDLGTELKRIIAWWQRRFPQFDPPPPGRCPCNATARWMDQIGPDECEQRLESLVRKLDAEVRKHGFSVPYQRHWGRLIIKQAIRRARHKEKARRETSSQAREEERRLRQTPSPKLTSEQACEFDADLTELRIEVGGERNLSQLWATWQKAIMRWKEAGKPVRTEAEMEERLAICRDCNHYAKRFGTLGYCSVCGCGVSKVRIGPLNKIRMATEKCPKKKWS